MVQTIYKNAVMKKIFNYLRIILSLALVASFTACSEKKAEDSADIGLGIKVFFPTKVVAGQPMTINGSGFQDVTEIIFPDGISVSDFKLVSNEMIRVDAPANLAAGGGKIIVRTADEEAQSKESLTLGNTRITGFSKQEGEKIIGGEQLTIFGTDLEFISAVELLDEDALPLVIPDEGFHRKGTSSVVFTIPQNIYTGSFAGSVMTIDGRVLAMPELEYEPAPTGHWELVRTSIWKNDGSHGEISWSSEYRFAPESNPTGEEIYTVPQDVWDKMKAGSFYLMARGSDWVQMRITTGWWSTTWTGADITTGDERIMDNGDGTYDIEINLNGDPIIDLIDQQHLLFTGGGYTPLEVFFEELVWVENGDGPKEVVIWENDGSHGEISWSSEYRFAPESNPTGEEIYTVPQGVWDKMKAGPFYLLAAGSSWVQMRITTGWWSTTWTGADITTGDERIIDNGDGTYYIKIDLNGDPIIDLIDQQHLLFTGGGYTPLKLYYQE